MKERRKGQRRVTRTIYLNGFDIGGKVWHPDKKGQVWIDDRRTAKERRKDE